ncbi:MAG TPA: efflux RND transporter periplasmic adaptor subunit [Terriglobales bacterium]|nr:efflux RND transporter periplasmic adaptor subunit [Terriglobales bacterium]
MKLSKRTLYILIAIGVAIVILAAFSLRSRNDVQYFTSRVEKGDVRQVVEATGTINAVTTVQVGSQVSGTIYKLNADFNSRVKKGQVIAEIDPAIFQGNVLQARADLENARANLAAARANLEKSKATAAQSAAEYRRTQALVQEGVLSQQQLDVARAAAESGAAQVSADQSAVAQAQAQVSQKAAALQVSETNLRHTIITAPVDGVVVARSVDVGQTVAASLQAPTLFTIAQDLTKMQVYSKTDESDVGMIKAGQPVSFKVDAFPNQTFRGRVVQVRMNPTTVQNVVTYDTIVEFDNPEMKLFPGMTAYVSIPVAHARDVLKVPNGALRFKPDMKPEEIRALYKKYGMEEMARGGGGSDAAGGGGGRRAGTGGAGAGNRRARQDAAAGETPGGGTTAADQAATHGGDSMTDISSERAVVWKLHKDGTLEPIKLRTGITDRTVTAVVEVFKGELKEGDEVITGSTSARGGQARMPGVGGPQRR